MAKVKIPYLVKRLEYTLDRTMNCPCCGHKKIACKIGSLLSGSDDFYTVSCENCAFHSNVVFLDEGEAYPAEQELVKNWNTWVKKVLAKKL